MLVHTTCSRWDAINSIALTHLYVRVFNDKKNINVVAVIIYIVSLYHAIIRAENTQLLPCCELLLQRKQESHMRGAVGDYYTERV